MKTRLSLARLLFSGLLLLPAAMAAAPAPASDLQPPEKRRVAVDLADTLLHPPAPAPLPTGAALSDPFHPAGAEPVAASGGSGKPVLLGDQGLLAAVAPQINPSGTLTLGSDTYLLFGEKKFKVGDYLTITFEGRDYVLEIAAIDTTALTFTLRLNTATIVRPIKGNSP